MSFYICQENDNNHAQDREVNKTQKVEVFIMQEVENKDVQVEQETNVTDNKPTENTSIQNTESQPSVEEQLQDALTQIAKLKRSFDKASSEAADYKKKYNATLSEKERIDIEKAEQEAERDEQFKALVRENQIAKLEKGYLGMKYTADEASRMAVAEADGDLDSKMKIMAEVDARKQKELEQEFMRKIPQPNFGVGDEKPSMTKEEFQKAGYKAVKDFKEKYPNTYKEYMK